MKFAKSFLRNLIFLGILGLVLFLMFPETMNQIAQVFGGLFGPTLVVLMIIVAALPRRK